MEKIRINRSDRVLFIGDSITDTKFNFRFMSAIGGNRTYALQTKKYLKAYSRKISVKIRGIASNRTYHVLDRLDKDCIDLKPDVVIMLIGVNDAWENYVPEEYPPLTRDSIASFTAIFDEIDSRLPDARILYLLPFMTDAVEQKLPFHKKLDEYREAFGEIARQKGAVILDMQKVFDDAQKHTAAQKLARDGIHPTNLGHRIMSEAIIGCLELE